MTRIQLEWRYGLAGGVFCLRRILSVKVIYTNRSINYRAVRPIRINRKKAFSRKESKTLRLALILRIVSMSELFVLKKCIRRCE
jgi:hypothetical protein